MDLHVEIKRIDAARADALAVGQPALLRLVELVETRDSGQVKTLAKVLAGLYNGRAFPVDLTDWRGLDLALLDDVLAVVRMDAIAPQQEIHMYLEEGEARFRKIIKDFGLRD